ncbi:MAG TPA: aminopeptidase P family protein [Anaerolineae bacterium]|nr:aminopeptidase P family protein [Anaerolineae bacterium]
MKQDIPELMRERGLDALVVYGDTDTSSDLAYLTGGAHLERAMYLHVQGQEPVLFASVLERENAAATGIPTRLWSDFPLSRFLKEAGGDMAAARIAQWRAIFEEYDVRGRVGFYGLMDMGFAYRFLSDLAAAIPEIEVVGEEPPNLFSTARETKDAREIEIMRAVGKATTEVIANVYDFLSGHRAQGDMLIQADGSPLTIGDVKAFIRLELAKRNLEETHEHIFSQGRDAGVPHNAGRPEMPLRLGQTIIFDIFPRDRATGYFHDITRTFFLGHAPDDLAQKWLDVKRVFDEVMAAIRVGEPGGNFQQMTCDLFEAMGYPTICSDPQTTVGYIHSLGHGVGLDIHEGPRLSHIGPQRVLRPGHVVSVEPGLYFPDEGWGVRIEDTIAFDENGEIVNLSHFPYEMVIPVRA